MSRVIGVLNYKGGTGKTTTVVNLAAGLAVRGERVLCIDLDAQGSMATHLGVEYTHSLTHLLLGQVRAQACITPARENLDLIPSDSSLFQAEIKLWRTNDDRMVRRTLLNKMQGLEDRYDYVILDFSPSAGLLSDSGLVYAHELIVPVSVNYMSLVGLRQVVETLKTFRQVREGYVQLYLIVPTFYADRKQDREVLETMQHHFGDRVVDPIRQNVKLAESPSHQMTIYEYSPRSSAAADYSSLVERVISDGRE
jgi:chromosome partitioning protein